MITRLTTLVLGAGASIPYGFPSGLNLFNDVIRHIQGEDRMWFPALEAIGFDPQQVRSFGTALRYSGMKSVDRFLARRPDLVEIGKAAITLALASLEISQYIFDERIDNTNWYRYLFDKMDTDWHDFPCNKLAVITFNYDRSFEHFLFTAIKHSYNKPDQDCAALLATFPIVHVHGQLGFLPWQGREPVNNYENKVPRNTAQIAATIMIISEATDDTPEFQRARAILAESERVYFLGFGYGQTNLKRLGIGKSSPTAYPTGYRPVRGTGVGMNAKDVANVRDITGNAIEIPLDNLDALQFLRNHADLT